MNSSQPQRRANDRAHQNQPEGLNEPFLVPPSDEPDEPGEGMLTRTMPSGGIEPRILSDADDPPLAEQMEHVLDEQATFQGRHPLRGAQPPPV